jgi:hypothetical protein
LLPLAAAAAAEQMNSKNTEAKSLISSDPAATRGEIGDAKPKEKAKNKTLIKI